MIFPNFQILRVAINIWRIKPLSVPLRSNCSLLGTDNVCGQISEHIFAPNGSYGFKHFIYLLFAPNGGYCLLIPHSCSFSVYASLVNSPDLNLEADFFHGGNVRNLKFSSSYHSVCFWSTYSTGKFITWLVNSTLNFTRKKPISHESHSPVSFLSVWMLQYSTRLAFKSRNSTLNTSPRVTNMGASSLSYAILL